MGTKKLLPTEEAKQFLVNVIELDDIDEKAIPKYNWYSIMRLMERYAQHSSLQGQSAQERHEKAADFILNAVKNEGLIIYSSDEDIVNKFLAIASGLTQKEEK